MDLRKYGAATTVLFPLIERDAADYAAGEGFASGDAKIMKDEGAPANTTNNPVDEGNGIYSLALTATELQAARIVITVIDQTNPKAFEDQAILIETYGHASAQHAFDLSVAQQSVTVAAINNGVITAASIASGAIAAAKIATDALEAIADKVLNRPLSSVEPGAVLRTLYGAASALVNRRRLTASALEIYKTDDSTVLGSLAATTDAAQEPLTELDP